MNSYFTFPCCNENFEINHDINDNVKCPKCNIEYETEFDDGWDGENENHVAWLGNRVDFKRLN